MPIDAVTEALQIRRGLSAPAMKWPPCLSIPFASFLLSALITSMSLLFFLLCSTTAVALMFGITRQLQTTMLLVSTLMAYLLLDVLFSLLWMHRTSASPSSSLSRAAFFRVKVVAVVRLLSPAPFHRLLYLHWHAQHRLVGMLLLDAGTVLIMLPAYIVASPSHNVTGPAPADQSPVVSFLLRAVEWLAEGVFALVALELVLLALRNRRERRAEQHRNFWAKVSGGGEQPLLPGGAPHSEQLLIPTHAQQPQPQRQREEEPWDAPPAYEEKEAITPRHPPYAFTFAAQQSQPQAQPQSDRRSEASPRAEGEPEDAVEGKDDEGVGVAHGGADGQGEAGMTAPTVLMSPPHEDEALSQPIPGPRVMLNLHDVRGEQMGTG